MAKPITKLAIQIMSPADVENALHEGFFEANRGRPGPIIIDIPDDTTYQNIYRLSRAALTQSSFYTKILQLLLR